MTATTPYESRPIRQRRTRDDMHAIRGAIYCTLANEHPMTDRQLFYRLVSEGVIAKTEAEYKSTVVRLVSEMRRSGQLPYEWLADNTRWMRKPRTYSSLEYALSETARTYRRALWHDAPAYVEVWLEKDALAGVLYEVTEEWDVPLMVTRGYPSLSYLYGAAEIIRSWRRPTYLYYFGDYDPSGMDITRVVEKGIRELAPESELHFERVAVQGWQIEHYRLQTRPTKTSDSRSRGFGAESVEIDAIPPGQLRALVSDCIWRHVDERALERLQRVEQAERETLAKIASQWSRPNRA